MGPSRSRPVRARRLVPGHRLAVGTFTVIRHGETEWSKSGRHTSVTDLDLLPEGAAAARLLAPGLAARRFALVLTSPRQRARTTAALAGFAHAEVEPDLAEWYYGTDEGITSAEIRVTRPGWDTWRNGFAGDAEALADVAARCDRVIARVRAVDGDTLAFAHSHLLRILAARWIGEAPEFGAYLTLDPAAVSELGEKDGRHTIKRWNTPA
jgi:broad specificity phosphatase PhoE